MRQLPIQRLSVVLWSVYAGLASGSPAQPTITSPPASEINRRQDSQGSKLFGYAEEGGQWVSQTCGSGLVFVTSSSYAACQPNTATNNIPTACRDDSIIEYPSATAKCPGNMKGCMTILIHSDLMDISPKSMLFCHTTTGDHHVFAKTTAPTDRLLIIDFSDTSDGNPTSSERAPDSETTNSSIEPTSAPETEPIDTTQTRSTSTNPTQSDPTSSSGAGAESQSRSDRNTAWIAGPVIGCIVGIAAIGFLVWFLLRRRRRPQDTVHKDMVPELHGGASGYPPTKPGQATELPCPKEYRELNSEREARELHCPKQYVELQG